MTAHSVDQAPAITPTEYERQTDRGVRVVDTGVFALRGRQEGSVPEVSPDGMVTSLRGSSGGSTHSHVFTKGRRAQSTEDNETWVEGEVTPTLNSFDVGDVRATTLIADTLNSGGNDGGFRTEPGAHLALGPAGDDDPLLPLGLDSHRYRCCGNGVVSNVAEWIGWRLRLVLEVAG